MGMRSCGLPCGVAQGTTGEHRWLQLFIDPQIHLQPWLNWRTALIFGAGPPSSCHPVKPLSAEAQSVAGKHRQGSGLNDELPGTWLSSKAQPQIWPVQRVTPPCLCVCLCAPPCMSMPCVLVLTLELLWVAIYSPRDPGDRAAKDFVQPLLPGP